MVRTGLSEVIGACGMKAMARPSSAPRARRHAHEVLVFEQQRAGRDFETGRQQLRDGAADHGFAGARFAHEPKDFSRLKIER
jgi:hypothetical protein